MTAPPILLWCRRQARSTVQDLSEFKSDLALASSWDCVSAFQLDETKDVWAWTRHSSSSYPQLAHSFDNCPRDKPHLNCYSSHPAFVLWTSTLWNKVKADAEDRMIDEVGSSVPGLLFVLEIFLLLDYSNAVGHNLFVKLYLLRGDAFNAMRLKQTFLGI